MKIMKDRIESIFKLKFIQDVGALQISTIVAVLVTMFSSLIIAKGLKPASFGIYTLALSLYGLVGTFSNVGVKQMTLVKLPSEYISQNREKMISIIAYYFKVSLIMGLLIMILGYIIAPYLSQLLYGRQDIGMLSRVLFLLPPLIMLYKIVVVILEGTRKMKYLAITESAAEVIKSLILIALVALSCSLIVLIYGWLIYAAISSILAIFIYNSLRSTEKGLPSIPEILKKYHFPDKRHLLRFNLSMGISENVKTLNDNLPLVLLGIFVLPKEVGYFKLAYAIVGLSMVFLEPVGRNLLVKLRQLQCSHDTKGLHKTFYRVSLYSGIISMILVALILIFYHFLVYFFLKDYKPSANIIYILAIYFCLMGFGIGLSPILRALERLDIEIKINTIGLLILIALSVLLMKNLGILGLSLALVISGSITKFFMYLSVKGQLNKLKIYA